MGLQGMWAKQRAMWMGALALAATLLGCETAATDGTQPLLPKAMVADRQAFAAEAAPLLETRCGDAMCHGRADRPYALFAAGARRIVAADTFMKTPLTAAEVDANYWSTMGFVDAAQPRATTLVQKAIGHLGHGGGPVFAAPSDPECVALTNWLSGEVPR